MNDIEAIKSALALCKQKGWTDAVRVLDQSEVLGAPWGTACTLDVQDYTTGDWTRCTLDEKTRYSLAHLYRVIRSELEWDGAIRLAVAACP